MKKKSVYLDHNIIIDLSKDGDKLKAIKENANKIDIYYSYGHVEEVFKFLCEHKNREEAERLLRFIDEITDRNALRPSVGGQAIVHRKESVYTCLERSKLDNTVSIVDNKSSLKFKANKYIKDQNKDNKKYSHMSSVPPDKIWDDKNVIEYIKQFNNEKEGRVLNEKNDRIGIALRGVPLVGNGVNHDIKLERGVYNEINSSISNLEYYIEVLFIILDIVGYCNDKAEKQYKSGAYDTTHSILATYCDYFISNDKKLVKRCKAIYNYIGVDTKVLGWDEFNDEINSYK